MSSRDTLKAIQNLQKERRKEIKVTDKGPVVTSKKVETSSSNTSSNKSTKKDSPSNSTLKAIENLQKERRATRITAGKGPTVAKPATVGKSPAQKVRTLDDIYRDISALQSELDTKTKKYTNEYWQSRLDEELDIFNKSRLIDEQERAWSADAIAPVQPSPYTGTNAQAWNIVGEERNAWDAEQKELKKKLYALTTEKKLYESIKTASEVMKSPDYKEFADKGANIANPTTQEARGAFGGLGDKKEIENIVTYSRQYKADPYSKSNFSYMTDEEVSVYNYLLAKFGKEKAQDYLDGIDPVLTHREGKKVADNLTGIDIPVLEDAATLFYGTVGGAINGLSKVGNWFSDEPQPTTTYEAASQYIDEDWSDDSFTVEGKTPRQWLYGGATTVGNMLPAIGASVLATEMGVPQAGASAIAAGLMGLQAGGAEYSEKLAEGYERGDAYKKAGATAVSEGALQYFIGGVGKLGGVSGSKLMTQARMLKTPAFRMGATAFLKLGGEEIEEVAQLYLDPFYDKVIFGEEYKAPTGAEIKETLILTALSTLALEAGDIAKAGGNRDVVLGENLIAEGETAVNNTIEAGLAQPEDSGSFAVAQKIAEDKKNGNGVSALELGVLANTLVEENMGKSQPATIEEAAQMRVSETGRAGVNSEVLQTADNVPTQTETTENTPFNVMADKPVNAIGEVTNKTKALFGDGKRSVGVADGRAYVTNSETILPRVSSGNVFLPVNDVEVAKTELGATESQSVGANISKILTQSDFTAVGENFVDGTLRGVGDVRVFTDEKGREIALKKDVAEYFEGYNLEATFRGGKPYAIKATDSDGNVAGVAMAVWTDSSGQTYDLTTPAIQSAPLNVMSNEAVGVRRTREAGIRSHYGFGEHGAKTFADVMDSMPVDSLATRAFSAAYMAGRTNLSPELAELKTDLQIKAFEAGLRDYNAETKSKEENVKKVVSHGKNAGFDSKGKPADVTTTQIKIVDELYKAMGVKGSFADGLLGNAELRTNIGISPIARDFQREIGVDGEKRKVSIVYHAAHEIAMHRLMELAPKEGQAFINAIYRYMGIDDVKSLAEAKREQYAAQGVEISLSEAMEEVAANQILALYNWDEAKFAEAVDRIVNGKNEQAKQGASKFKQILDSIIAKFNSILETLGLKERQEAQAELDELVKIRDLFEKAFAAAVAKNKEIAANTTISKDGVVTNSNGEVVAQINEDGTASFSLKTYDDSGRAELQKWLDKKVNSNALTKAEAKDISEQLEYFYGICKKYEDKYAPFSAWSKAEVVKGLDGKPLMSVVKANGDYSMNLDFSLVCKKRRPLDALYRAMIDDGFMDNITQLSEVDVARINEIIRKHGFETACTLCFVDSKRYRAYAVADAFVSKYNELVKMLAPEGTKIDRFDFSGKRAASAEGLHTMSDAELKSGINKLNKAIKEHGETTVVGKIAKHLKAFPQDRKLVMVSDFMDSEGFVRVKKANPNVLKLYNMSKGSGGPKATLPDVQYLGEILKKQGFTPKRAYAVGGVRVQSFSDYIPRLVFDYLQMTADLTAKKLPAHAYSKEDIFVLQFGKTGIKINMSLVPAVAEGGIAPGLDKDGNYVWVDGHTFASDFHDKGSGQRGFELAVKIQNTEGYAQNCGTIAVGVSDEHIIKMLKDNDIRMVIPYHKSSLNHFVAKMGNIDQYKDYTSVQNTRYRSGENVGKKITGKDFSFNEAFHRLGDAKAATKEYLAWCDKNDYLPKFSQFAFHKDAEVRENYYKVLIDFAAYDSEGNPTPQGPVTMNFPTENDAFGSMTSLIEKGLEADAILEGRKEKQIPEILNEVKAVIGETGKKFSLKGYRADGIEVYETSKEVKQMPVVERQKLYVKLMNEEYVGRTARFVRNGHTYYAEFDRKNIRKAMYGDNRSSESGKKALTRIGADGDIFDLVENSTYKRSEADKKNHKNTDYFDYFIKTVQIDDKVYDLLADVKKQYGVNGGYVYTVVLTDNKKIKAAPAEADTQRGALKDAETTLNSGKILSQPEKSVKSKHSLRDSEGNTLTEAQAEYFKDSKVRDENGNLRVMYHGTPTGGFTEFKLPHYLSPLTSAQGAGYYFTDRKNAEQYTRAVNGKSAKKKQVYETYLNITNPLEMSEFSEGAISDDAFRRIMARGNYKWGMEHTDVEKRLSVSRFDSARLQEMTRVFNGEEILKVMKEELGYDGVRYTDRYGDIWVAWDKSQIKNRDNANPTADPDIRFSLRNQNEVSLQTMTNVRKAISDNDVTALAKYAEKGVISTEYYNQLVEQYGAIAKGENPHRDVVVPQKTEKNKKVSQTVRTILEAKATPDEAVPTIEKMVEDGIFSYDVYTDKQAINDAESYIKEYGWDESLDDWFDAVSKGEVSKDITAMGWALYNNAANIAATTTSETERTSAIKTSLKILDAMVKHQRSAAQALQATRILKKLSPETQLYGVQKSVQSLQRELEERYGDKAPDLKIDEELAEEFLNAKTQEERDAAEEKILKDIGRQMPSRFIDKWNAWRYLAMLGNPRTHIRNIGGNAGFAPIVAVKNLTATAIESAVYRVSGKKTARSKAFVVGSKADRALLAAAWEDYTNVADMISNGGKYSDFAMANQTIEEGRQIFKTKPLEWARKGNSKLLEMEDMWFSKPHYAYALAQYCKANNITAEQLKRGKALGAARQYAIKEAQKATYRDTNAISHLLSSRFSETGEYKSIKKAANTAIDGILPFRKTPANILARGLEYSLLGLLNGIKQSVWDVQRGKKTSAEAIDSISAGLTGTGLMALGAYLASQMLVRGRGEDDEEKEFKELMGHQSYSLELPNGTSITLDWLAPEALPFFVGVNLWEAKQGEDKEMNMSAIIGTLGGITAPMLEMSCLQGLNDVVEGVGYASSNDTSALMSILSSAATSYLTQGLPTIFGQAERTGEESRMTTYTEKNDFLTGDMQYTLGKASAKIPFWDYHQIPYIDAWGRKEASGTALKRGLNNFLNPAYTSTIETSSMERELLRIYEKTGEGGVFPERADKYFTVDGKRKDLTAEEYVKYATLKGKKSYELVSDLVKSKAYKNLSNEEKAEAIKEAYDYANQKAKKAVANYKPEKWVTVADKFGDNVGNFISFRTEVSSQRDDNGGKISKQEVIDIALDMAQSDSEIWDMYLSMYDSKADLHAHEIGVGGEDYMSIIQNLDVVDKPSKSGKLGTYTNDEIAAAISMVGGLSRSERAELWQSMTGSTSTKNNPWR